MVACINTQAKLTTVGSLDFSNDITGKWTQAVQTDGKHWNIILMGVGTSSFITSLYRSVLEPPTALSPLQASFQKFKPITPSELPVKDSVIP